jgi:hypothetical protein
LPRSSLNCCSLRATTARAALTPAFFMALLMLCLRPPQLRQAYDKSGRMNIHAGADLPGRPRHATLPG